MRRKRELKIGAGYHVTAKINLGEMILEPDNIKQMFIGVIEDAANCKQKHLFILRNIVIMDNHIHLYIKPHKKHKLSVIMQWVLGTFAKRFNTYYKRKGHVFYDRFHESMLHVDACCSHRDGKSCCSATCVNVTG